MQYDDPLADNETIECTANSLTAPGLYKGAALGAPVKTGER